MIKVTRFNGTELHINATLIEAVEATPDTVITLLNSKKIVVKDSLEQVVQRITEFYQTIGLVGMQVRQNAGCERVSE